jgi:hypothetical protein
MTTQRTEHVAIVVDEGVRSDSPEGTIVELAERRG